ncbi:uncharacterized protein J8A68_003790 [[Candida] subhashii]|uniref:Uncharacterized protein n=1 Tax=[Candida] subhashii TaxID=561895 RepID=A0A8J5UW23_9ASCO|nr:uncharacterized protein J8A68_003790 [[Candida] subhashii]KAG7662660.1 hypothetical protein J8A68_003790 [[Candida] subhashii]
MQCSEILMLPEDVINLICRFLPDSLLLEYCHIPILGRYAIGVLNTKNLKVYIGTTLLVGFSFDIDGMTDHELNPYIGGPVGAVGMYQAATLPWVGTNQFRSPSIDSVDSFIEFIRKHPHLRIKKLIVDGLVMLKRIHTRGDSSWLRSVQKIELVVMAKLDNPREFIEQVRDYHLYGISSTANLHQYDLPHSVQSLYFGWAIDFNPSALERHDLTELYIRPPIILSDSKYLPRGLKVLNICLQLGPAADSTYRPNFPPGLELLEIGIQRDNTSASESNFDLRGLESLNCLNIKSFPFESLYILKAPKQISALSIESSHLASLRSIAQYHQLKRLSLKIENEEARSILEDCKFPNSLESLQCEWDHSQNMLFPRLEGGPRDMGMIADLIPLEREPIFSPRVQFRIGRLPPNLKMLNIRSNWASCNPTEWDLPESLRVLILNVRTLLAPVTIPSRLVFFSLFAKSKDKILPRSLPKSLIYLNTSLLPSEATTNDLTDLSNLSSLEFSEYSQTCFEWKLPITLERLVLKYNKLCSINIKESNLKELNLSYNCFRSFDNLKLPETLEELQLNNQRSPENGLMKLSLEKLTKNLKSLDLSRNNFEIRSLSNLSFERFHQLSCLNLSSCNVNNLKEGMFPESVKFLHLDGNRFEKIDRRVFQRLPNLMFLNLWGCNIGDLMRFGHSLEFPESLQFLSLSKNRLDTTKGLIFPLNSHLKSLTLQFNEFRYVNAVSESLRGILGQDVSISISTY